MNKLMSYPQNDFYEWTKGWEIDLSLTWFRRLPWEPIISANYQLNTFLVQMTQWLFVSLHTHNHSHQSRLVWIYVDVWLSKLPCNYSSTVCVLAGYLWGNLEVCGHPVCRSLCCVYINVNVGPKLSPCGSDYHPWQVSHSRSPPSHQRPQKQETPKMAPNLEGARVWFTSHRGTNFQPQPQCLYSSVNFVWRNPAVILQFSHTDTTRACKSSMPNKASQYVHCNT